MNRIARVFPTHNRATPTDALAFTSSPGLFPPHVDEVHISVTFTWDQWRADVLAREWEGVAPVQIGGPGVGMRGEDFTPGMYLKPGYVITSRGCPNRCWFCSVWKREGNVRELPIRNGWNVLDDNLLACSESHIRAVFGMLKQQPQRAEFTGGFEAARLQDWHIDLLADLKPKQVFFAYDTPDDLEPLQAIAPKLKDAGFTAASHCIRCYVLIGYPKDSFQAAEERLRTVIMLGFFPMAMLYRNIQGKVDPQWRRFQREWARPHILGFKSKLPDGANANDE